MLIHSNRIVIKSLLIVLCAVSGLGFLSSSAARAEGDLPLADLIKKVKPAIVLIEVIEKGQRISSGSGYVVDPSGIIGTNYHVVEGAKEIRVTFPGDKALGSFKADGFLAVYPKKDMALIKIDPKDKKLTVLPLAKEIPSQGEKVAAFGAPLGYSDTVSDGIVSAIRTGKELTEMMTRGGRDGYGKDGLGYEVETTWLQTTAPISPGNSGGPLVNMKGEAVGMNSFVSTMGQNLNFSLSITHVIKFIADSGKNVQSFANLPPPRERHGGGGGMGDPKKTLDTWVNLNRAKNDLDKVVEDCEQRLRKLPPVDPRNPLKGANIRNRKIADFFKKMGTAFSDYSSKISGFDNKEIDQDLLEYVVADTVIAKKISDICKEVANASSVGSSGGGSIDWENGISAIKSIPSELETKRELLRVNLGLKYNKTFPTQKDTADEDKKNPPDKKKDVKSTTDKKDRSVERVWKDKSGKFEIRAKCVGVDGKIVKLEKSNGTILRVPIDKLSEEDKEFLESTE